MSERIQSVSRRTLMRGSLLAAGVAPLLAAGPVPTRAQGAAPAMAARDKRPVIHPGGSKLGAYDPYGDFSNDQGVVTEHLFLPWEDVELGALADADAYALARRRNVLVTVEPWSWAQDWNVTAARLRDDILAGRRDANMRAILEVLAGFKSPVTIRWAQEMDNPYGRFTWSNWRPADYVAAFRRMAALMRRITPDARIMWSPRGERTLGNYYPGSEFVDLVGLTVFGYDKFDVVQYGRTRTFAESVKQGYDLTVGYGKPIWVAELGYAGGSEYVARWAQDVTRNYPEYPELKEVVYFNDREVWAWPRGLGRPNWRVVAAADLNYPRRERP
ncbi:hypothetical protein [Phenylobacterium sp.]|uniref:hypothetical protein n=1 Tax=Phenylobacterium sp. TaxID=1871053 RepID=UPI00391A7E30